MDTIEIIESDSEIENDPSSPDISPPDSSPSHTPLPELDSENDAEVDQLADLRMFLAGITQTTEVNHVDMVKLAITLLTDLPATRDGVLEYFETVFHSYVASFVSLIEKGSLTLSTAAVSDVLMEQEIPLLDIRSELYYLINEHSIAWASIVSKWCLELLGNISSRHGSVRQIGSSLNDRIQLWTACAATKHLIDINNYCMSKLIHSNIESSIDALLDMSVQHAPHFDWVVVHVGSSFPEVVITRVLSCGLKDFCNIEQQASTSTKLDTENEETPKINSVVGILGRLAKTHFTDIKNALQSLFQWSLEIDDRGAADDKAVNSQKTATVPYFLHLASMSPVLLKALTIDSSRWLNVNVLLQFSSVAASWSCFFNDGRQGLLNLIVHLLLHIEEGTNHIFTVLFEAASLTDPKFLYVSLAAQEIVELLISEIDLLLRITELTPPLIRSFYTLITPLRHHLLSDNSIKSSYAARLFILMGKYNSQYLSSCISYMLIRAQEPMHIERLIELTGGLEDNDFFGYGLSLAFQLESVEKTYLTNNSNWQQILWKNVNILLKWEKRNNESCQTVLHGLMNNFTTILTFLKTTKDIDTSFIIASIILDLLEKSPRFLSTEETILLTDTVAVYFFSCLTNKMDEFKKLKHCRLAIKLITKCCSVANYARTHLIRLLVETALYPPLSRIFGAIVQPDTVMVKEDETSIWEENLSGGNFLLTTQGSSSLYHTGVVGTGLRKRTSHVPLAADECNENTRHLMSALQACCNSDVEIVTNLGLHLVSLISPDVMFNGLPWPEEDFCKVTIERDLSIRKAFDTTPLLWTLLRFVAVHRPALCFCSVLLRAVAATTMAQWTAASQNRAVYKQNVSLTDTTISLLDTLSLGQLLTPPLNGIRDILKLLDPPQVLLLLRECVWTYLRDHVPSPALFDRDAYGAMWRDPATSKPTKQYTETLRIVMMANIDKLGILYDQLFGVTAVEPD